MPTASLLSKQHTYATCLFQVHGFNLQTSMILCTGVFAHSTHLGVIRIFLMLATYNLLRVCLWHLNDESTMEEHASILPMYHFLFPSVVTLNAFSCKYFIFCLCFHITDPLHLPGFSASSETTWSELPMKTLLCACFDQKCPTESAIGDTDIHLLLVNVTPWYG